METCTKRYFRVERKRIGYLRFIVESYDGLAMVSTIDASEGIVSLATPECLAAEVDQLIQALKGEMTMSEIAPPAGVGSAAGELPNA